MYTKNDVFLLFLEAFVVCQHYNPPEGYIPNMSNPLLDHHYSEYVTSLCSQTKQRMEFGTAAIKLLFDTQTICTLRLIVNLNFPLPRSACPIYFVTMNEW